MGWKKNEKNWKEARGKHDYIKKGIEKDTCPRHRLQLCMCIDICTIFIIYTWFLYVMGDYKQPCKNYKNLLMRSCWNWLGNLKKWASAFRFFFLASMSSTKSTSNGFVGFTFRSYTTTYRGIEIMRSRLLLFFSFCFSVDNKIVCMKLPICKNERVSGQA